MQTTRQTVALLAVTAAAALGAGCGSDDGGSGDATSLAGAKATLSKDCQQGKASDKPLCDCIADELASAGNGAEEILAIDEDVGEGKMPASLTKAAGTCGAR